jgi:hypothetical protein
MVPTAFDEQEEERRGRRGAMFWGAVVLGIVLVLFLASAFVWIPDGPFDTPAARPPAATGMVADQGAGGGAAGEDNQVILRRDDAVGPGRNANGQAAEIGPSATSLRLDQAQHPEP